MLRCKEIESLVKVLECFVTYKIEVKSGPLTVRGRTQYSFQGPRFIVGKMLHGPMARNRLTLINRYGYYSNNTTDL